MKFGKLFLVLCMLQSFTYIYSKSTNDNIVYTDSDVRFTLITDGVVRMEYAQNGNFVDNRSFIAVNRNYPRVDFDIKKKNGWIEIKTSKMKLRYKLNTGKFTANNPDYGVYDVDVKPGDKVLYGITEDNFMQVADYICTRPATPNNAEAEQED